MSGKLKYDITMESWMNSFRNWILTGILSMQAPALSHHNG